MAPTAPTNLSAREKRLARISGAMHPLAPHKTHRSDAQVDDGFLTSKKDKRTMKHSAFVSKIDKAANKKKPAALKRRRPSKKLVATMESLADALPELDDDSRSLERLAQEGRVRHKSLKSRPGALKRKEKVVRGEMQRFGASMAALASVPAAPATAAGDGDGDGDGDNVAMAGADAPAETSANAGRWAALRRHISTTMEQNPAFSRQGP